MDYLGEEGDIAGENQTAMGLKSELVFGEVEEGKEDGEVEEAGGDDETLAFGSNVDGNKAGGSATKGVRMRFGREEGRALEAEASPAHQHVFEKDNLTNLIHLLLLRRHGCCRGCRAIEAEAGRWSQSKM